MKGFFIAIYGVNNIGKSTHAKRLVEHLISKGIDAVYLKYPIYDLAPTGPEINRIIRSEGEQKISEEKLQTLFMQNRRDFEPTLKKMLSEGKIVVAEDYTGTGLAWGTAKGLDLKYLEDINSRLLKEDMCILITGERDTRATEKQHIHEQNPDLLLKVKNILLELADKYGWKKIELQQKIEDTEAAIWKVIPISQLKEI